MKNNRYVCQIIGSLTATATATATASASASAVARL
jgi:hypothetical protein